MNTVLELTGVALAALLSENLVLVSCMGIGTHQESWKSSREAIRTGLCLTVVMVLGVLGAWMKIWPPSPPTAPLWAPPCW